MSSGIFASLKSFDAYPKMHEDMKVRTCSGAAVSIIAGVFIFLLFISELSYYLTTETVDHLYVDVSRDEKLAIHFNVTFPHIPCSLLSLDAMDVSGEHQLDVHHNIKKKPLDPFGNPKGVEINHVLGHTMKEGEVIDTPGQKPGSKPDPTKEPGYCGKCYGAEQTPGQCCNTCDEVRAAYRQQGWALANLNNIEQCVASGETGEQLAEELRRGDGCQMYGYLKVNKVAGNFHFAPGKSFQHAHMHVHDLAAFQAGVFNVSHVVNTMSFGEKFPGAVNPLDASVRASPVSGSMYSYYVKVVPTEYAPLRGEKISTNQFSVTEHYQATGSKQGQGLPGVFFFYELSPIMVKFSETRSSFLHFITQLCAIVGGVFTVAGMIDGVVYHGIRHLEKKMQMGKLS